MQFQSTHPVRGATHTGSDAVRGFQISIHAPREGCDELHAGAVAVNVCISIHAPREGCDKCSLKCDTRLNISIHAPREGCDTGTPMKKHKTGYFNPRTP